MSNFVKMTNSLKPREKLLMLGKEKLSDAELLAIIIQVGGKNSSVMQVAQKILEDSNGFDNLFSYSYNKLISFDSIGDAKATKIIVINEIYKRINKEKSIKNITKINSPKDVFSLLKYDIDEKQEKFYLIMLNTNNSLIKVSEVFKGTLNQIIIHPREIFKEAIINSANKIIISHNHPSNNLEASDEDINITKKILYISQIIGIELIDHVIISKYDYKSIFKNYSI